MNWFKKKNKPSVEIKNYTDFWNWFLENEARFYLAIKNNNNIEKNFIEEFSPIVKKLNERFFFLAGMLSADKAELIITADGDFKVIPYIEDLINAAPKLENWLFTAHKSPGMPSFIIEIEDHQFSSETINFAINEHKYYPDEIDLTFVYKNYNEEHSNLISNGVFIYLDSYLGEIRSLTSIDKIKVVGPEQCKQELISIDKLEAYLKWRESEFIEKYNNLSPDTAEDYKYASLEATTNEGLAIVSIMNTTFLGWNGKASHPWMIRLDIYYNGSSNNGMPEDKTYQLMDDLEDDLLIHLKESEGFLNLGRETGGNLRTVYFACKDFRKPVRTIDKLKLKFSDLDIKFEVYKDKYWMSLKTYIDKLN